jgi:3-oxoadipate enol-lactonase
MGGMIAQEYALAFGDGLRSVSLVATYAEPGPFCAKLLDMWAEIVRASGVEAVVREVLLWCFTPAFYEDQRELAQEFDDGIAGIRLTAAGFLAQLAAIQRHDTTERLGALGLPTLVLAGEADMLIPPIQSRRLHAAMPGAEWVTVQGGHAALWEFPETFNAAVLDFIGRH